MEREMLKEDRKEKEKKERKENVKRIASERKWGTQTHAQKNRVRDRYRERRRNYVIKSKKA